MSKSPYQILKSRYHTEKTAMLSSLKEATSNRSLSRFDRAKVTFEVALDSNKVQIRKAFEKANPGLLVEKVNVVKVKPRTKRRTAHGRGKSSGFKKAIITLKSGLDLE